MHSANKLVLATLLSLIKYEKPKRLILTIANKKIIKESSKSKLQTTTIIITKYNHNHIKPRKKNYQQT